MPSAPPKDYRFSHVDWNKSLAIEAVRKPDGTITYCVYDFARKEIGFRDEFYLEDFKKTIYPPPSSHPSLLKEGLIVPSLFGEAASWETWISRLNEEELVRDVKAYINQWLILPPLHLTVLTAYVLFTWTHERSFVKPYLNIWGERGTGKSSVIESALVFLCRYAQYYGGAVTPASLLRSIDEIQGTSILDESDFRSASKEALESNDLLLRILRGGYKQSGCYSLAEKEGTKHFPTVYRIGNPKIIIGRRVIQDDALRSRCLELKMEPVDIPRDKRRPSEFWHDTRRRGEAQEIINRLILYRFKHLGDKNEIVLDLLPFEARLTDTAQPLWYCLHTNEDRKEYLQFVGANANEVHDQASETLEGQLLAVVQYLLPAPVLSTRTVLKEMVSTFREKYKDEMSAKDMDDIANPRRFAWRMKGMGIKTKHGMGGNYIEPSQELLKRLYEKYGVIQVPNQESLTEVL